jgi:hypothetical protein
VTTYHPRRSYGLGTILLVFLAYLAFLAAVISLIGVAVVVVWNKTAGAAEQEKSALATPYHSAPGHGPSISAWCHAKGIVFGYHPWDHTTRNFQVYEGVGVDAKGRPTGKLLLNVNPSVDENSPEVHWTFDPGDYVIQYANNTYEVREDLCDTAPTTTTASTTTTSAAPTTTTGSPTTTASSEPPTTTSAPEAETTTSTTSLEESSSTSITSATTPLPTTPPAVELGDATPPLVARSTTTTTSSISELPHTGSSMTRTLVALSVVAFVLAAILLVGSVVTSAAKKRFDYERNSDERR